MFYTTIISSLLASSALASPVPSKRSDGSSLETRRKHPKSGTWPDDCQRVSWEGYIALPGYERPAKQRALKLNGNNQLAWDGSGNDTLWVEFHNCRPHYGQPGEGQGGQQFGFLYAKDKQQCVQVSSSGDKYYASLTSCSQSTNSGDAAKAQTWRINNGDDDRSLDWYGGVDDSCTTYWGYTSSGDDQYTPSSTSDGTLEFQCAGDDNKAWYLKLEDDLDEQDFTDGPDGGDDGGDDNNTDDGNSGTTTDDGNGGTTDDGNGGTTDDGTGDDNNDDGTGDDNNDDAGNGGATTDDGNGGSTDDGNTDDNGGAATDDNNDDGGNDDNNDDGGNTGSTDGGNGGTTDDANDDGNDDGNDDNNST